MKKLRLLSLLGLLPVFANAQSPAQEEILKAAMDSLSADAITCTAYYAILSETAKLSGDDEAAAGHQETYEKMITIALNSASRGSKGEAGMKEVRPAGIKRLSSMMAELEESDLDRLHRNYAGNCALMVNDLKGATRQALREAFANQ